MISNRNDGLAPASMSASILALLFLVLAGNAGIAADFFAAVNGAWRGGGTYRDHAGGAGEPINCRMNLGAAQGDTLKIAFDCRGIDRAARISGEIKRTSANGNVAGKATMSPDNRVFDITGRLSGTTMQLALSERRPKEGRPSPVSMVLGLKGGKAIAWTMKSRDPMTGRVFTSLSVNYSR